MQEHRLWVEFGCGRRASVDLASDLWPGLVDVAEIANKAVCKSCRAKASDRWLVHLLEPDR